MLDLIRRMTIEEKIGQLIGIPLPLDDNAIEQDTAEFAPGLISVPVMPWAQAGTRIRSFQRHLRKNTRLGIPAIPVALGDLIGTTRFPVPLARAAAWDRELVQQIAAASAVEALASGVRQQLAPAVTIATLRAQGVNVDLARCFGGSPLLAAELVAAHVRGLQGGAGGRIGPEGIAATATELGGTGALTKAGASEWHERVMRTSVLPAAESAVAAGVAAAMPAPTANAGIAAHADSWLLREVLRGEWRFTGYVLSAHGGIGGLVDDHRVTESLDYARALALEAGVDAVLESSRTAADEFARLTGLVATGAVPAWVLDEAVSGLLRVKIQLGLFEDPFPRAALRAMVASAEHRALAERTVAESVVLLSDPRDLLPLDPGGLARIAVVAADPSGANHDDDTAAQIALADELQAAVPNATVRRVGRPSKRGCWDLAVAIVGGEAHRAVPAVSRLVAEGVPAVVLLYGTQTTGVAELAATTATVLHCWQPTRDHAKVLSRILLGELEPGGRLPMHVPARARPRASDVAFHVGHGGGYTTFAYSQLQLSPQRPMTDEPVVVQVRVTNTGTRAGKEVVQVYLTDRVSSVIRPERSLVGFTSVELNPGQSRKVRVEIPASRFALWDPGMRHVVEPGSFDLLVGRSMADIRLRGSFSIGSWVPELPAPRNGFSQAAAPASID